MWSRPAGWAATGGTPGARRPAFVASGKFRNVKPPGLIGGVVAPGPYDEDDAQFMAEHMVESGGMPRTAVRVKRATK